MVIANNHDESSARLITIKRGPIISPIVFSARKNAKNAADVVRDDTKSGISNSPDAESAAWNGLVPSSILTIIASETTIALSTRRPNAMIRAARDT